MRATWLFVLLIITSTAIAQEDPTFSISVGAFFTDRESRTRVDGDSGRGTDINLEDDLGLKKSDTVFRVDGYWRFAEKHRFDFSAFDLSRSSSKQIEREITWDDTTYPFSSTVKTDLDLTIYKAAYTWMFLKRNRSFLGVTAGLYVADLGATLSTSGGASVESNDLTAPLPVIGLRGEYRFANRWSLRGSGEIFAVDYGDYEGFLYDVFAGLDFGVTKNVAIGVGVNAVEFDIGVSKNRFQGDLKWQYEGALVYLKFDF